MYWPCTPCVLRAFWKAFLFALRIVLGRLAGRAGPSLIDPILLLVVAMCECTEPEITSLAFIIECDDHIKSLILGHAFRIL